MNNFKENKNAKHKFDVLYKHGWPCSPKLEHYLAKLFLMHEKLQQLLRHVAPIANSRNVLRK